MTNRLPASATRPAVYSYFCRVFLLLHTDDFQRDWQRMRAEGVHFREEPRHEAYGTVAVFDDLYGNGWDLLEPRRNPP